MSDGVKVVLAVGVVGIVGYFVVTLIAPRPTVTPGPIVTAPQTTAFLTGVVGAIGSLFTKPSSPSTGTLATSAYGTSQDSVYNATLTPLTSDQQSSVNSFNTQTQAQQEASIFS